MPWLKLFLNAVTDAHHINVLNIKTKTDDNFFNYV